MNIYAYFSTALPTSLSIVINKFYLFLIFSFIFLLQSQPSQDLQDSSCSQPPLHPTPKSSHKKTKRNSDATDELVGLATEYFKRPSSEKEEDIVAKGWAMKMMKMDHDQRRLAERIITDVLLDGEMGSLTWEGMRFVTSQRPWTQPPSSRAPQIAPGQNNWLRYPNNFSFSSPPQYSISPPSNYCHSSSTSLSNEDEQNMTASEFISNYTSM